MMYAMRFVYALAILVLAGPVLAQDPPLSPVMPQELTDFRDKAEEHVVNHDVVQATLDAYAARVAVLEQGFGPLEAQIAQLTAENEGLLVANADLADANGTLTADNVALGAANDTLATDNAGLAATNTSLTATVETLTSRLADEALVDLRLDAIELIVCPGQSPCPPPAQ